MFVRICFTIAICAVGMLIASCDSLLVKKASPESIPVEMAASTTNDVQLVAVLKAIQAVNNAANPTPTAPIISTGLGGLIVLAGSFAAYWQHRRSITRPP